MRKKFDIEKLYYLISVAKVEVTFIKNDGTERVMYCTLQSEVLPVRVELPYPETANSNILKVWDIENDGWRSFNIDTVKSVRVAGLEYSPGKSKLLG